MKYIINSILLVFIIALANSCTVEKRLHNPGYHIEWKNSKIPTATKAKSDQIYSASTENSEINISEETIVKKEQVVLSVPLSSRFNSVIIEDKSDKITVQEEKEKRKPSVEKTNVLEYKEKKIKLKPDLKPRDESDLELNRLAIIGLGLVASSLLLFFTLLPGMYVCAVALRQIRKEPNRYNNKGLALTGLILSYLVLSLAFFIYFLLEFAFGGLPLIFTLLLLSIYLFFIVSTQVIINT